MGTESQANLKFAQDQASEAADLRLKVLFLERRLRVLERQLETIRSSWTWRIGRLILFPITVARWTKKKTS